MNGSYRSQLVGAARRNCRIALLFFISIWIVASFAVTAAAEEVTWDLKSDTWVATDALGRRLPTYEEVGPPRANRWVGIFYHLWHGVHSRYGPYDVSVITNGFLGNPNDLEGLEWGPAWRPHHWGEPELGYYVSDDAYVIRKHCQMLVDAGVDTLIYDCSNEYTYKDNYTLLANIYQQIRAEGGKTPQFCFMLSTGTDDTNFLAETLYDELYSKNLFSDLWFMWKGKPLICTHPDGLRPEVQQFFSFRSMINSFGSRKPGYRTWAWTDRWPQDYGWDEDPEVPECVIVMPAVAPMVNVGRSHYNNVQPGVENLKPAEGLYFSQNWERALELDPEFIYLYGWNEWTASRFIYPDIGPQGYNYFLGRPLEEGDSWFADSYSWEFSKGCEPMKGGHTDNYYYQMTAGIRRYKGVRPPDPISGPITIVVDGDFHDWDSVQPEFRDTIGDTLHRDHPGYGNTGQLVNTTGRNDIIMTKVAYDDDYIYFYARTKYDLTSHNDPNWMLLFIDADDNHTNGWEGYDYLVNYPVISHSSTTLKHSTGGWNWTNVKTVPYQMSGNQMELRILRSHLGQSSEVAFNFHWADNIQKTNDIIEFSVSGDSAPNRRFMYPFKVINNLPLDISDLQDQTVLPTDTVYFSVSPFGGEPPYSYRWFKDGQDLGVNQRLLTLYAHSTDQGHYHCTVTDSAQNVAVSASAALTVDVRADIDHDGDVDLEDFGRLQACFSGAGQPHAPGCEDANLDLDEDIDLADMYIFQDCLGGAKQPPGC